MKKKIGGITMRAGNIRQSAGLLAAVSLIAGAVYAQSEFPFEQDLILDVQPMKGSKRVPVMEIDNNGMALVNLWCDRMQGRAEVSGGSITITPVAREGASCPPDRAKADEDMIEALQQVTGWQRSGSTVVLTGAQTLKFRLPTN